MIGPTRSAIIGGITRKTIPAPLIRMTMIDAVEYERPSASLPNDAIYNYVSAAIVVDRIYADTIISHDISGSLT